MSLPTTEQTMMVSMVLACELLNDAYQEVDDTDFDGAEMQKLLSHLAEGAELALLRMKMILNKDDGCCGRNRY